MNETVIHSSLQRKANVEGKRWEETFEPAILANHNWPSLEILKDVRTNMILEQCFEEASNYILDIQVGEIYTAQEYRIAIRKFADAISQQAMKNYNEYLEKL